MRNCLRADFARLFRSRFFWLLAAFLFAAGILDAQDHSPIDTSLLLFVSGVSLLSSLFAAFFIGTDYSDGTIRNKLIVGKTRAAIYFSNLITVFAAAELMNLCLSLPTVILAPIFGRGFALTAKELLFRLLIENLALLATLALIVLVTMLVKSRSSAIVLGTLLVLGLFVGASVIDSSLREPEYFQGRLFVDDNGNIQYDTETKEANPNYVRGTQRKILETAYDILPGGQFIQMSYLPNELDPAHGGLLLLYSAGILAASILIGVPTFQRGDLK